MPGNPNFRNQGNRSSNHPGSGFHGRHGDERRGGGFTTPPPMQAMPSPYNFVEVADEVAPAVSPDKISHDTPFKEGLSGWIDIEVEATTPIYIRATGNFKRYREGQNSEFARDCQAIVGRANEQAALSSNLQNRKNFADFTDFYRLPDERAAIPGTSLRGVLRNLLEMVTNSRLGPVNDRRYAVRDLNNNDRTLYGGWMTAMSKSESGKAVFAPAARAGWLRIENHTWTIEPCEFARIEHDNLILGINKRKSAEDKYTAYKQAGKSREISFSLKQNGLEGGLRYDEALPDSNGQYQGTLVFTGSPNKKKHLEFVFYQPCGQQIELKDKKVIQGFKQTHSDERDEPTGAWKFWKKELDNGEDARIPIFYLAYPSENEVGPDMPTVSFDAPGAHLHAFGLAMMFRLAYRHTLREAVPASHREDGLAKGQFDFVESLFGYQREKTDDGLRGRVSFGPCAASKDAKQLPPVVTVLSAPKPTYYPNYFEQSFDAKGNKLAPDKTYATLMDEDSQRRLRGWKFYPAHPDQRDPSTQRHAAESENDYNGGPVVPLPPSANYRTATAFRPLAAGTKFKGRLRFHNLRPAELGALVWALTWGDNDDLRHRIGMAKPLGYGCAKIRIVRGRVIPNDPAASVANWDQPGDTPLLIDHSRQAFETLFAQRLASPAIQQDLLSMANPNHGHTLRYPTLPMDDERGPEKRRNEFADSKKANLVLPRWRVIDKKPAGPARVDKSPVESPRDGGRRIDAPFVPHRPQIPTGPRLSMGNTYVGTVIAGKGERLRFLPDGFPENEAGAVPAKLDAKVGERWNAKPKQVATNANIFELISRAH